MLIMEDASCQFTDAEFREQEASGTCPTEFMFAFELSWSDVRAQVESRGYGVRVMSMADFQPRAVQWTNRERLRRMAIEPIMTQSAVSSGYGGPAFRWMYHADFIRFTIAHAVLYTKDRHGQFYPYMVYEFPTPLTQAKLDELVDQSLNLRTSIPREPTLIISNSAFYDNQSVHHLRHGDVDDAQPEDDDVEEEINHVQEVLDSLSAEQLRDALDMRDSMSEYEEHEPIVPTTRPKRRLLR